MVLKQAHQILIIQGEQGLDQLVIRFGKVGKLHNALEQLNTTWTVLVSS